MKKIPMRMCIVTREKLPKKELIRVVKSEGEVVIDETGKLNGKGCYFKKDIEIINQAKKRKILSSVLETDVKDEVYDELIKIIN
jgi:predicted RNA-binding protein YlxR (DUF448 family)